MERFFPTLYSFQAEGAGAEERELFGPLVGATEAYVEELPLPECTVSFDSWQRPGGVSTVFLSDVLGRIEASRFSHAFVRPAGTTCVHIPRKAAAERRSAGRVGCATPAWRPGAPGVPEFDHARSAQRDAVGGRRNDMCAPTERLSPCRNARGGQRIGRTGAALYSFSCSPSFRGKHGGKCRSDTCVPRSDQICLRRMKEAAKDASKSVAASLWRSRCGGGRGHL
ncbi:unnamed protein product [Prorocentrum cordatum]|uniref:Uncharacterized protein n=1 Tax=Prorocentrum cordatum TaxID=2364126 RepID=A0ABN9X9M5_9DINO|nr:unnamed protein product [Polarella glacialis]